MNEDILAFDWSAEFEECEGVNDMVDVYYELIERKLNIHCPLMSVKKKDPTTLSKHSLKLIDKKIFPLQMEDTR